jgi:hypothetical protein
MVDRDKLYEAIRQTIWPYADTDNDDDATNDSFVTETATFLTQEIVDMNIEITEEQTELDDDELENLPISNLSPHLTQILSVNDPIRLISSIIQLYCTPVQETQFHHYRIGQCEVSPIPFN